MEMEEEENSLSPIAALLLLVPVAGLSLSVVVLRKEKSLGRQ